MKYRPTPAGFFHACGMALAVTLFGCHAGQHPGARDGAAANEHASGDGITAGDTGAKMSTRQMSEALEFVAKTLAEVNLKTLHGLPDDFNRALSQARGEITQPLTEGQFYFVLSRLLASLGDAHTRVEFSADSQKANRFMDVPLVWLEAGPVVARDAGGLNRGDRITRIGGRPTGDVMAALMEVVPHENRYYIRGQAPDLLVQKEFLHHLGVVSERGTVSIEVERNGQLVLFDLTVDSAKPTVGPERNWVGYTIDESASVGLFWVDVCKYDDEYAETLAAFMKEVAEKHIQDIVVDLSQNTGGNVTVAFALLSYMDRDYRSFSVDQRTSKAFFAQYPMFEDKGFQGLMQQFNVDLDAPVWKEPAPAIQAAVSAMLPPVDPALKFRGRVHGIIGPRTFSSGNQFATLLRDNNTGLLLGEPTGNAVNFHGQQLFFDIPNTSYTLSSSSTLNVRPDPARPNTEALFPDVPLTMTAKDIQRGAVSCPQCGDLAELAKVLRTRGCAGRDGASRGACAEK